MLNSHRRRLGFDLNVHNIYAKGAQLTGTAKQTRSVNFTQVSEVQKEATMNRDDLIREYRMRGASWPALVGVYAVIVGTMVLSAMSMT